MALFQRLFSLAALVSSAAAISAYTGVPFGHQLTAYSCHTEWSSLANHISCPERRLAANIVLLYVHCHDTDNGGSMHNLISKHRSVLTIYIRCGMPQLFQLRLQCHNVQTRCVQTW